MYSKFFHFFKKRRRSICKLVIFVDSGGRGVRSALTESVDGRIRVLCIIEEPLRQIRGSAIEVKQIVAALYGNLNKIQKIVSKKAAEGVFCDIKEIHCIFSSIFYFSGTRVVTTKFDKSTTVDHGVMANLLAKAGSSSTSKEESVVISERIVDIHINGYKINNPYKKEARDISVSLFKMTMDKKLVQSVERTIESYFRVPVYIEPSAFVLHSFLNINGFLDTDATILYIGDSVSEISLIKNGLLSESISIPGGYKNVISGLASKLNETEEGVISLLKLFTLNKLSDADKSRIEAALRAEKAAWYPIFQDALLPITEESQLPEKVILITDQNYREVFKNFLLSESFLAQSLRGGAFDVFVLEEEALPLHPLFEYKSQKESDQSIISISIIFAYAEKEKISLSKSNLKSIVLK